MTVGLLKIAYFTQVSPVLRAECVLISRLPQRSETPQTFLFPLRAPTSPERIGFLSAISVAGRMRIAATRWERFADIEDRSKGQTACLKDHWPRRFNVQRTPNLRCREGGFRVQMRFSSVTLAEGSAASAVAAASAAAAASFSCRALRQFKQWSLDLSGLLISM